MDSREKAQVLIAGQFSFSRGEAASNYVLGLGQAISQAGFVTEFVTERADDGEPRPEFLEFRRHFAPSPGRTLRGWRAAWQSLSASENGLIAWLRALPQDRRRTLIAYPCSGSSVALLLKLRRLCQARRWGLIVAVVEWQRFWLYGPSKFHDRLLTALDSELQVRMVNKRIRNVIAVSRALMHYYVRSDCRVLGVPPLIDTEAKRGYFQANSDHEPRDLRLLFSGAWCRDRLDIVIEAIRILRTQGKGIRLEFLGAGAKELASNPVLKRRIEAAPPGAFKFHGWVPTEKVLPITASVDFGVLLRNQARWSNACFPSKVAEFQGLGVPLICNLTSDLTETLRDGENALIIPAVSLEATLGTFRRALALTPSERSRLRHNSLKCATTLFDYRRFVAPLGSFIRQVSSETTEICT